MSSGLFRSVDFFQKFVYSRNQSNLKISEIVWFFTNTVIKWLYIKGSNCVIENNECESNPCVRGTCEDRVNEFVCKCFTGFGGVTCSENINECAGESCSGHGICTDLINRYECVCEPGYTGVNCEVDINECASYPCQNGGTCSDEIGAFNCSCKPGYAGNKCQIDVDECETGPCKNGATCLDQLGKYSCICTAGYTGEKCDHFYPDIVLFFIFS